MSESSSAYRTRVNNRTGRSGKFQLAIAALGLIAWAAPSAAQVRILPTTSRAGATERYVLRIENDHRQSAIRVEIRFPQSVQIVSLGERSAWRVQDIFSGNRMSAAVWTGTLSPGRFTELGFIGVNPPNSVRLVWPVIITFANGEQVAWWTGNTGTKAPVTLIAVPARNRVNLAIALGVCIAALALALSALILALRSGPSTEAGFQAGAG